MKIVICTRDLEYGVGSVVLCEIKAYEADPAVEKVIVIGPKAVRGFSGKVEFVVQKNVGRFFITKEPIYALRCRRSLQRIIERERPDLILTHFPLLAMDFGVEMHAKFHGLHRPVSKRTGWGPVGLVAKAFHSLYSYFDYCTIRHADSVLFVSRATMEEAKALYPAHHAKFEYAPNSADSAIFYPATPEQRAEARERLGLDDGKTNLLYVGRLDPMKGILQLLDVLHGLDKDSFRLVVIGEGPLREAVRSHPFVKHLGRLEHRNLREYYIAADLFVLPSLSENSPMTVLEAKACGCPVLASAVGDNIYTLPPAAVYRTLEELKAKLGARLRGGRSSSRS
jgi:glycosyltransferase involved in cell wall biosynthesis